ncbi:MAG: metallophosphoesterase [Ruminococcus sp.]|nr:metallophosphoesterase [Ruminococcus sp.]
MIYITGDSHGNEMKFTRMGMDSEDSWTSEDKLIICGDFGFVMYGDDKPAMKEHHEEILDRLAEKPYDILFVDGNHENFDRLYRFPQTVKYGNTVHKIRRNIFYLQRGRVYEIEGKTFFAFGGAYSVDKSAKKSQGLWWHEELPDKEDFLRGRDALKNVNYKVDYIITHTAPGCVLEMLKYALPYDLRNSFTFDIHENELRSYFDEIWNTVEFRCWYFGHFHFDKCLLLKARALFIDVEIIDDK